MPAPLGWSGQYSQARDDIYREATSAREQFPPFNSAHDGWAVLWEEVDEIWDEVRADNVEAAIAEAIQAGAMCVRFVADMRAKLAAKAIEHVRPRPNYDDPAQQVPCACGHSETPHLMTANGCCARTGCACRQYRPSNAAKAGA